MNDFNSSLCPNCNKYSKVERMDDEGKYFVECLHCGYQTPHFKFVAQAQASWLQGGVRGSSV